MKLDAIDDLLLEAIASQVTPGACYAVGTRDGEAHLQSLGRLTYSADSPAVMVDTLWDLASLTKVVATSSAAMHLVDNGSLDLDSPVGDYLLQFKAKGKSDIRVRNLLLHNSGLPASHPCPTSFGDPAALLESILGLDLEYRTGTATVYSDVGFITLAQVLEVVSDKPLNALVLDTVWRPLEMSSTMYRPSKDLWERCAPTETDEHGGWVVGQVHDPTARALGGVAGHAGVFSTVLDLATLMRALLARTVPFCSAETVALFTARSSDSSRTLGWDTPTEGSSAGTLLGPLSFGHTGFTGTSIWADPDLGVFAVLLTNRVHPTAASQGIRSLRPAFHDAVIRALQLESEPTIR